MRLVNWRYWAVLIGLAAVWALLGFFFDTDGSAIEWIARIVITGQPAAVFVFIAVYTALGFRGAAKWWRTDFGNRIVMFPLAVVLSSCVLVWSLFFAHGSITGPFAGWLYLGGYLASDLQLLWGTYLWTRASHEGNGNISDKDRRDSPGPGHPGS